MRPHGVRLISFISYTRHIYVYSLHIIGRRTLLCLANSSQLYPPNVIRVPRAETLLTTSFRFYLTIDTLVVQLVLYYRSRTRDFHSLDINHARHTKKHKMRIILCYKTNPNNNNDTHIAIKLIGPVYIINFPKLISTFSFFNSPSHIIPAKAPNGVK